MCCEYRHILWPATIFVGATIYVATYGHHCEHIFVGHCINNSSCNQETGVFDGGCAAGWIGSLCEEECSDGAYGYGCVNNCSGHCMGDSPCNKQTGYCDRGCKPGYTNASCNKKCSSGTYGKKCTKTCSGYCLHNKSCDHIDGACTDGCQNGYIGHICNTSCEHGHYGKNCSHNCSKNCKKCKHTDGTCSCYAGWGGPNCTKACNNSYGENCQYTCGSYCVNQTCDRFDGTCQLACPDDSSKSCNVESLVQGSIVIPVVLLGVFSVCGILVIAMAVFLIRRIYTKVHSGAIKLCWESSLYETSTHIDVPEPTYQELYFKENPYQNTTIN